VPADQVIAAARASTCAYSTVASKFVTNYWVDKIKEGSSRSCNIITAILEPTNGLVGNTLSGIVSKIMTRETLAIEEIPMIIKPSIQVIVVSIDIHSSGKLRMIYLRLVVASIHP